MTRPLSIAALLISTSFGRLCLGQPLIQVKVVRGTPFSAEAITESNQVLADGNRIIRTSKASIARDSEGRTRRATDANVVFLQDPVVGVAYVLDPQSRSARKAAVRNADAAVETTSPTAVSLGMQFIEGFETQGVRITRTLAAREADNERPLEIVSESWYSAELQTVVMSKTTDPRLGETKLTDIRRGEPLRSLFEVPTDYTIRAEPQAQ